MNKKKWILVVPYVIFGLLMTNVGEAWRLSEGGDASSKLLSFFRLLPEAFANPLPGLYLTDLLAGLFSAVFLFLIVTFKRQEAKKFRRKEEYGSARWGNAKDIAPFVDPVFQNNVILTQTERLTMASRPKDPATARNKNVLVVGDHVIIGLSPSDFRTRGSTAA